MDGRFVRRLTIEEPGMDACKNCGDLRKRLRPRSLCYRCYMDPEIRAKFPPNTTYERKNSHATHLETEEDVARTIAEQLQCLPKWFMSDYHENRPTTYQPRHVAHVHVKAVSK